MLSKGKLGSHPSLLEITTVPQQHPWTSGTY